MRQVIREPTRETPLLKQLRDRAQTDDRFHDLVEGMRRLSIDGLTPPSWLSEAAELVIAEETRRLYAISQRSPSRTPGPRPQRDGDD